MPSKMIYDESNWLFKDPQKNTIHDITIEDINQLLNYAEQDNAWAEAVKHEVVEREKAIRSGTCCIKSIQIKNTESSAALKYMGS